MQLGREGRDKLCGEDVDDVFVLGGHGRWSVGVLV